MSPLERFVTWMFVTHHETLADRLLTLVKVAIWFFGAIALASAFIALFGMGVELAK